MKLLASASSAEAKRRRYFPLTISFFIFFFLSISVLQKTFALVEACDKSPFREKI